MASITREACGRKTIQFIWTDKRRRSLRLGKVSMETAKSVKGWVESIVSAQCAGVSIDSETAAWLGKTGDELHERLVGVGLAEPRPKTTDEATAVKTLESLISDFNAAKLKAKDSTRLVWGHTQRKLVEFFGAHKDITAITEADAERWAEWLEGTEKLSRVTVRKRCGFAKQFFRFAVKSRWIASSPFAGLKSGNLTNRKRDHFITRADAKAVLAFCPDAEYRLLFALSRFGGLRSPSETFSLRRTDIDWQNARIRVRSPKTEHHEGHDVRVVPIFPELLPYLRDAAEVAPEGAEYVIVNHRRVNVRTRLTKIIRRAGLEPWPKLLHNLRASRQTELEESFPTHVVCAWLGNSPKVAKDRYLQVTEDHFAKAVQNSVQSVQNPVHNAGTRNDEEPHEPVEKRENCRDIRRDVVLRGSMRSKKVEDRGLEPLADFDASENAVSTSGGCAECRAAGALHPGGLNCHCLAALDADLQRVIAAWDCLPAAIRKAMLALIGSK